MWAGEHGQVLECSGESAAAGAVTLVHIVMLMDTQTNTQTHTQTPIQPACSSIRHTDSDTLHTH